MRIVGLTGKATSGKDTFASLVARHCTARTYQKSLAKPLKAATLVILGHLYQNHDLITPDLMWSSRKEKVLKHPYFPAYDRSCREYLQEIGQAMKEAVGPNLWTDILMTSIRNLDRNLKYQAEKTNDPDLWRDALVLVTDVRFDMEAEPIKAWPEGGQIVKIERDSAKTVRKHVSESGVSDGLIDLTIQNNKSLKHLELEAKEFVKDLLGERYVR